MYLYRCFVLFIVLSVAFTFMTMLAFIVSDIYTMMLNDPSSAIGSIIGVTLALVAYGRVGRRLGKTLQSTIENATLKALKEQPIKKKN